MVIRKAGTNYAKKDYAILARVRNTGEAPRPKTMFEPGEELLVIDGPFTDFKGVVQEVEYEKSRLTLTINVFNRPTQD